MLNPTRAIILFALVLVVTSSSARAAVCDQARFLCDSNDAGHSQSTSSPAYPSTSSHVNLNPGTVPTNDQLGIEALYYKSGFDFSLVKGTGRIGAAVSLTNGEETFFGPSAFEISTDYLTRKENGDKYESQKYNLATGFVIYDNKSTGLGKIQLNAGVGVKYNRLTHHVWPGGGLSAVLGPLTLGVSGTQDDVQLNFIDSSTGDKYDLRYATQSYSVGIYLQSLALDYTTLMVFPQDLDTEITRIFTASLLLRKLIFTGSYRLEDSDRPAYDPSTRTLVTQQIKHDVFGGVQAAITRRVLVGAFYNYYLLRDISVGLTWFF